MLKTIAIFTIVAFLVGMLTIPVFSAPQQAPTAYEVIAAVNALRASYGLDPYSVDSLLMLSAQGQAAYLASMAPSIVDGHTGPGGTDADARALAVGYPYVEGLDINENWAALPESADIDTLIYDVWGDSVHMHTMLHDRGQHVGMGVATAGGTVYYVLDVAAYWGDAGLTPQPTHLAYGENAATQQFISQYIAPVVKATAQPDGSIIHLVQSGQSLWMLAHHYGVEIDRLRQLNYLGTSDMIYIGQKIMIQPPATATVTGIPTETVLVQDTSTAKILVSPSFELAIATQSIKSDASNQNLNGWFLAFFALFGLGLILVVVGLTGRR